MIRVLPSADRVPAADITVLGLLVTGTCPSLPRRTATRSSSLAAFLLPLILPAIVLAQLHE